MGASEPIAYVGCAVRSSGPSESRAYDLILALLCAIALSYGIRATHDLTTPFDPDLSRDVGFQPSTPLEEGVRRFVEWYRDYYSV